MISKLNNQMHIVYEYKNNLFTSLFCHTFDNRDKHKLQRKNCRSYFLNITWPHQRNILPLPAKSFKSRMP